MSLETSLQGVRPGPRDGSRGARQIPRDQGRLHPALTPGDRPAAPDPYAAGQRHVAACRSPVPGARPMTRGIYVVGAEQATGKSAVALGVRQLLAGQVSRLGVFRPVVGGEDDPLLAVLRSNGADTEQYAGA